VKQEEKGASMHSNTFKVPQTTVKRHAEFAGDSAHTTETKLGKNLFFPLVSMKTWWGTALKMRNNSLAR
jgi:hypothetical protein